MAEASVLFATRPTASGGKLGIATLNVEKTLNSLSLDMVESLLAQLTTWRDDDDIVAVMLDASGEKAFCAGGDVQQLYQSAVSQPGGPCEYAETFFEREYRLDYLLHRFPKPLICWGHGIVMGGGLGLFAGCRHTVVTEKTRVAMPEITIALYPDVGGTWFLPKMPGQTGLFIALTGAAINAADALYAGIARHYATHSEKESRIADLLQIDWHQNEAELDAAIEAVFSESCELESNLMKHRDLIDAICGGDELTTIVDRITALDSDDKWLQKASATLAAGSAIAANTIWQQFQQGRDLNLEQVFQFELMLSTNVVRHPEFAEGVRALLIDKDKSPKWQYAHAGDVPGSLMQQFTTPPWPANPLANIGTDTH